MSSSKVKVLHSSDMFLPHEAELQPNAGQPEDRSSDLVTGTMDSRCVVFISFRMFLLDDILV